MNLTNETTVYKGVLLRRIQHADGTLGGFVESEANLLGHAWVAPSGKVHGSVLVSGTSVVHGEVCGDAWVHNTEIGLLACVSWGDWKDTKVV